MIPTTTWVEMSWAVETGQTIAGLGLLIVGRSSPQGSQTSSSVLPQGSAYHGEAVECATPLYGDVAYVGDGHGSFEGTSSSEQALSQSGVSILSSTWPTCTSILTLPSEGWG